MFANLITDEIVFQKLYDKYLITQDGLPDTSVWENTQWNVDFEKAKDQGKEFIISMVSGIIYRIKNDNAVENISMLKSYGNLMDLAFDNRMRKCFRLKWLEQDRRTYIQWFSPVSHRLDTLNVLDNDNGGTTLPLKPFLLLKDEDNMFCPYHPSDEDLFAKDWIIDGFDISELRDELVTELINMGGGVVEISGNTKEELSEEDACTHM